MTANAITSVTYRANPRFKPILLNSSGAMRVVNQHAARIHSRACGMFGASNYVLKKASRPGKNRCHAFVATGDKHAMRSNALHMTLLKAMGR